MNHLLYKVAERILDRFFRHQLENESFPVQILGLEESVSATFVTLVGGQRVGVKVAGKIDRIDRPDGHALRVIDYKTGKVEGRSLEVKGDALEELLTNKKADKVRQLWLYKYIVAKKMLQEGSFGLENRAAAVSSDRIVAGIYSFRNIGEGLLENKLSFSSEGETLEEFVAESEKYLTQLVHRLLDPNQPFERTNDLETCNFCTYKGICAR